MTPPEAPEPGTHAPHPSPATLRALQLGSWHYQQATRRLALGPEAAALVGPVPAGGGLDELLTLLADEGARRLRRAFIACLREGSPIDVEAQFKRPDGRRPWLRFIGERMAQTAGEAGQLQGFVQDISTRKQAQEDTLRLAMRLTTTLASITEAFATLDRDGRFTYLNPVSERLLQSTTAQLLDEPIWEQLQGEQPGRLQEHIERALQSDQHVQFEDHYPALDKWLELTAHPYIEGLAVYFRDISERKAAEAKIHRLAFYDTLTGLPNRQYLIEQLEQALARRARATECGALLFIDLDNFKTLNDTRGHPIGDLLLQRVAERLRRCMRRHDTVARIGGDEFVVILQDLGSDPAVARDKARAAAGKVLARMAEPFDLDGRLHHSTVSIGVALFDGAHDGGVSELLKQADLAMYQAKHLGRNTQALFEPTMLAALNARVARAHDMRAALDDGQQFALHYQPQFDRAGHMVGAEVLLRWNHPQRGLILPGDFIPVAEDTGLIIPLGLWVLGQTCRQLAAWSQRPGTAGLTLSVNVSALQFRHPDFIDQILATLAEHGAPADRLRLELTESMLSEQVEATHTQMLRLREIGVGLSLDDFGTGYSSLMYLRRLPLDELKIDKIFVDGVLANPADAAIVQAIIGTAHSLGLHVIAEGVETQAQHQFLAARGCDLFQGYLLAQPMAIDALGAFMAQAHPTGACG